MSRASASCSPCARSGNRRLVQGYELHPGLRDPGSHRAAATGSRVVGVHGMVSLLYQYTRMRCRKILPTGFRDLAFVAARWYDNGLQDGPPNPFSCGRTRRWSYMQVPDSVVHPTSRVEVAMPQLIALELAFLRHGRSGGGGGRRRTSGWRSLTRLTRRTPEWPRGQSRFSAPLTWRRCPKSGQSPSKSAGAFRRSRRPRTDGIGRRRSRGPHNIELRQLGSCRRPPTKTCPISSASRPWALLSSTSWGLGRRRLDFVPIEGSAAQRRGQCWPRPSRRACAVPGALPARRTEDAAAAAPPCEAALLRRARNRFPAGRRRCGSSDPWAAKVEPTARSTARRVFLHTADQRRPLRPPAMCSRWPRRSTNWTADRIDRALRAAAVAPRTGLRLEDRLGLPVKLVDPFGEARLGRTLAASPPSTRASRRWWAWCWPNCGRVRIRTRSISSIPAAARSRAIGKKWAIAGSAAAVLLLAWLVYARIDHFRRPVRVAHWNSNRGSWTGSLTTPSGPMPRLMFLRWADEDVHALDRFSQLCSTQKDAVWHEASVTWPRRRVDGALKGWAAGPEVIARMAESVRGHGYALKQEKAETTKT